MDDSAVNAGAAVDRVDLSVRAAHDDGVVAGTGVEAVGASPSAHVVLASSAPERSSPRPARTRSSPRPPCTLSAHGPRRPDRRHGPRRGGLRRPGRAPRRCPHSPSRCRPAGLPRRRRRGVCRGRSRPVLIVRGVEPGWHARGSGFGVAGWYKLGFKPGEPGPAVIVGHVDSTSGPAVFYRLGRLTPGAQVRVSWRSGCSVSLRVYAVREYAKSAFPTARVYGLTRRPELRLVTCGPSMSRPTTTSTTWSSSHAAPGALGLSSTLGQTTVREPANASTLGVLAPHGGVPCGQVNILERRPQKEL